MSLIRWVMPVLLVASIAAAFVGWRRAEQLRAENEALRAQIKGLNQIDAAMIDELKVRDQEMQRLREEAHEIRKLRNEVSQLRAGAKEAEKLRAENQQLRNAVAGSTTAATATPSPAPAQTADHFTRENWAFAGYATPEAALVSAVWAMREGNPKTYLESLSPEEQLRMAKAWENKPEAEVAAKHRQDMAGITGVRILERQNISPNEVQMSVYVEGVRRMEVISMQLVNNEWKFGGFRRNVAK